MESKNKIYEVLDGLQHFEAHDKRFDSDLPEYLLFRCCMCPNLNINSSICPGIPGTPHPTESPCRFVKHYKSHDGFKFKVSLHEPGIFKIYYQNPCASGSQEWKPVSAVTQKHASFDEAQATLTRLAKEHDWLEWNDDKEDR